MYDKIHYKFKKNKKNKIKLLKKKKIWDSHLVYTIPCSKRKKTLQLTLR